MDKGAAHKRTTPYVLVLGTAQDGGYPQLGCEASCCRDLHLDSTRRRFVTALALIDPISKEHWLVEATPDLPEQVKRLSEHLQRPSQPPSGILLTHAHMGHYTGLMYLGREVMGASGIPVFALPRMAAFLRQNGPWSQLVSLGQIDLKPMVADSLYTLNKSISVQPILVPHRDEYSETAAYIIHLGSRQVLFVPDIDKWQYWDRDIRALIQQVDIALLDGTFYKDGEIKGRSMADIPHPFVSQSMDHFQGLSPEDKQKVHFIHFNHTNPLLVAGSEAQKEVLSKGFRLARQGMVID